MITNRYQKETKKYNTQGKKCIVSSENVGWNISLNLKGCQYMNTNIGGFPFLHFTSLHLKQSLVNMEFIFPVFELTSQSQSWF